MQFRFVLPAYTDGRARLLDPPTGERIDIDGPAGTFDMPSVLFEHQLKDDQAENYNLAYFAGFGMTVGPWGKLDTTHGDTYNHQGYLLRLGVKADRLSKDGSIHWYGNLGIRAYIGSDDINPARSGDNFQLYEATGGGVFQNFHESIYPAFEFSVVSDFSEYHAFHAIPQLIVPLHESVDLKAGTPLRIGSDGEKWGFRLQLSTVF